MILSHGHELPADVERRIKELVDLQERERERAQGARLWYEVRQLVMYPYPEVQRPNVWSSVGYFATDTSAEMVAIAMRSAYEASFQVWTCMPEGFPEKLVSISKPSPWRLLRAYNSREV